MTQHDLIRKYCEKYGSILPAKLYGEVFEGQMLGSELSKRCRELRAKGILESKRDGKFERFYLKQKTVAQIILPAPFKEKSKAETQNKLF